MGRQPGTTGLLALTALVLAGGVVGAAHAAGEPPRPTAYRKPIALPPLEQPGRVDLALDPDVYRDAQPSLADVRIRDGDGAEIPFRIRRQERSVAESARELSVRDLVTTHDGALRFVLDAGVGAPAHQRVRLSVRDSLRNFRVPVRVETATDGGAWQIVREAGFIYRIEADTKTADTTVSYRPSTARFVRVTVGADHGRSLPLAGVALVAAAATERSEERVAATVVARDQETMRRTTRLVLDRRSRRPVDRVEIDVAEREFRRVLLVEGSDDRTRWAFVGSGAISAVENGGVREHATSVRVPETAARYLRLTIQNVDEPALTVSGARLFAVKRSVVFDAVPGRRYTLEYGAAPAPLPPPASTAAAAADLDEGPRRAATLGASQPMAAAPATRLASATVAAWSTTAAALLTLASLVWRLTRGLRLAG